jgi:toxin-antitoxin system PIN domain toxin
MQSLLDVNVLIALIWPAHPSHRAAQDWFHIHARHGWATCPITQNGFVRIVSNTSFSAHALSVTDAIAVLERNLKHPTHEFWPAELSVAQSVALLQKPLRGHRQLTDAYLLGQAIHKEARFVTFDKRIASLLPEDRRRTGIVVELSVHIH